MRDEELDFDKYQKLKEEGKTAKETYLIAKKEGLNTLSYMKILCKVYHLSIAKAKEIIVCSDTGVKSLSEYQEKHILPALREVLEQEGQNSAQNENKRSQ